ncbi:hypothetical protein CISG_01139 [Coccidioides immitis RMSCC 3703]|uniref:Uncharacterized protein n=1 Tax=Coccidioides immitis RMSCC 3703 TaxID=454286 RepID=A0A0J8QWG6_COCIT|nr:hypothetical protein CISG_01139 [Coccidioides immitis RMSCC 3703]
MLGCLGVFRDVAREYAFKEIQSAAQRSFKDMYQKPSDETSPKRGLAAVFAPEFNCASRIGLSVDYVRGYNRPRRAEVSRSGVSQGTTVTNSVRSATRVQVLGESDTDAVPKLKPL